MDSAKPLGPVTLVKSPDAGLNDKMPAGKNICDGNTQENADMREKQNGYQLNTKGI